MKSKLSQRSLNPMALVFGLCAHGLDIVRALSKEGVEISALETNKAFPGLKTKLAHVTCLANKNQKDIIQALKEIRPKLPTDSNPVLFLTNDRMIFEVSKRWSEISDLYRLSWSSCIKHTDNLLIKTNLELRCKQVGLNYPPSWILHSSEELPSLLSVLSFPLIVKPIRPQSGFKAAILSTESQLQAHLKQYSADLPFIFQAYIPGDVTRLLFCAIYFKEGKVHSHFEGRKLSSLPQGLGTTTIAEPIDNPILYQETLRFFEGYNLSGPVSLEMKQDPNGSLWVIEPTVFRTDFWMGCCVANGVNFPYIEYSHMTGRFLPTQIQYHRAIWVDIDRDPLCFFKLIIRGYWPFKSRKKIAFTYLKLCDPMPGISEMKKLALQIIRAVFRRIRVVF